MFMMYSRMKMRNTTVPASFLLIYRGTSLIRNTPVLGPQGGGRFLMSEVPLYNCARLEAGDASFLLSYRGASLIRNAQPPRITIKP